MTYSSGVEKQLLILHVADIICPIYSNDMTYILETPKKKEKSIIWASHLLIPLSIAGKTRAFLGPLPKSFMNPNKLKDFFPCLPYCKPCAFENESFELGYMEQPCHVFCSYPSTNMMLTSIG